MSSSGSFAGAAEDDGLNPVLVITNFLLFVLFFGLAATVDVREFRSKFEEKRGLFTGVLCQFFIVPVLGFVSTKIFQLEPVLGVTLLILCSSPGGSYSNWWCSLGNADLALSVAMTTTSTFVSMVMLPVNTLIYIRAAYGADVELDWLGLIVSLIIAIGGIGSGLYCGNKLPARRALFNGLGQVAGLSLIVISTVFSSRNEPIWNRDAAFYGACALPCCGALFSSYVIASLFRLRKPESVAVVIETAYQNVGLATSIAVGTFPDERQQSMALGIPLFYGVLEAFLIAIWCTIAHYLGWSYAPAGTPILKAIAKNFQPGAETTAGAEWPAGQGGGDNLHLAEMVDPRNRTSSAVSEDGSPRAPYSPPAMSAQRAAAYKAVSVPFLRIFCTTELVSGRVHLPGGTPAGSAEAAGRRRAGGAARGGAQGDGARSHPHAAVRPGADAAAAAGAAGGCLCGCEG